MLVHKQIATLIVEHIQNRYSHDIQYANNILDAIRHSLVARKEDYDLPSSLIAQPLFSAPIVDDFQVSLSKINEKEARRKKEGVFYTDSDVTDFVVANTFLHYVFPEENKVYSYGDAYKKLLSAGDDKILKLLTANVFDPTCGAGEFLLSALSLKLMINRDVHLTSESVILASLYGNDIEKTSTEISKLRLFFFTIDSCDNNLDVIALFESLDSHFTNKDAVDYDGVSFIGKDIIIGNPPYVEYRDFQGHSRLNYGNVYADVLHYAAESLNKSGIMAFVIPLSFVATVRMSAIRDHIQKTTNKQIVMNFADRPDSLFSSVHQKLTILIAQKDTCQKVVLSSGYNYWYQEEREHLFQSIHVLPLAMIKNEYWPKIGNKTEMSIFKKMVNAKGHSILSMIDKTNGDAIYLNQRGCFWMKAFTKDMNSKSYTPYFFPKSISPFVFCLINSSLFFLLWIIISDGWHVTNKELSFVKIPKSVGDIAKWQELQNKLETKLEATKVYVNTKQVDFEYKHKLCKDIIDEIDNELALIYKFSTSQLNYIKSFALKYRIGDGA